MRGDIVELFKILKGFDVVNVAGRSSSNGTLESGPLKDRIRANSANMCSRIFKLLLNKLLVDDDDDDDDYGDDDDDDDDVATPDQAHQA